MSKKLEAALSTIGFIILLIFIGFFLRNCKNEEEQDKNKEKVQKEVLRQTKNSENPILVRMDLNEDYYIFYDLPNESEILVDRVDDKDLLCLVNDEEITWKKGEKPLENMDYTSIGFKLPENYHGKKKFINVTHKKT